MKHLRLRARFLLVLIALLAAVFTAITLVIVRQNSQTLRVDLVNQSKIFADLATQPIGAAFVIYHDSGTIRIQQEIDSFTSLDRDVNQVEVVDTTGQVQFVDDTGSNKISVTSEAASSVDVTYLYNAHKDLIGIVEPYLESFGIHRYAVVYGVSYQSVNQAIQKVVTLILSLSLGILLISLIVWYWLINRLFLRPVAQISQTALLISKGDLNRQIHLGRNDEIGDLGSAVDTMATSLKDDIAKLKEVDRLKSEFLMITSHNLRTPLTIIKGYLDMLKSSGPTKEQLEMIEPVAINVMRLGGFAEDVLTISTIEAGQGDLRREVLAMRPILERIATEFETLAAQKKITFTAIIQTDVSVNLDKSHFHSAIWNLLDNAYKFTPQTGLINLTATTEGDKLKLTIKDSGIGISADELPKLFTKFHRGTDTLTYDYEGTGIGLYICKLIIEQHGGSISVASTEGEGSTFTIWLPTAKA